MTLTKHIPSVPLPFPFRSPSVMQVKFKLVGRALTRFLSQTLSPFRSPSVPLPLSFRHAGKTTSRLNAVSCHRLKMLTDPGQEISNALLAKFRDGEVDTWGFLVQCPGCYNLRQLGTCRLGCSALRLVSQETPLSQETPS